ncbi:response regulator transcription factor [Acidimangrovimonas sediminis]|uniref:response regulator transcription factor n=1 Tax=Acidimangrovimonas sediminis TaxID=2056283 RepID=UPI000C803B8E|nr:response regulator transcription factor [Acidimangrovimonas sediminis]
MADGRQRDTVLVVDDSPEALSLLTTALREADLTVLVALDGESALAVTERVIPDIILLDAVMPGTDGFETCRRLKALPTISHIPVIFMTGLSDTDHVIRGFQVGGIDYVTKPVVVEELIARMHSHLANARQVQSARVALDAAGRALLAVDGRGRALWSTPQVMQVLGLGAAEGRGGTGTPPAAGLAGEIAPWLRRASAEGGAAVAGLALQLGDQRVELSYLCRTGTDEYLLRLTEAGPGDEEGQLREALAVTAREAEVLLWLARGKSNRSISDILGISSRTVDKHLEQIYNKLGVENRASAAAMVVRVLGLRA